MGILEILIISVGLSMDAFAVSICKGLSVQKMKPKHALIAGAYFGGFQALMPLIGYFLGTQFEWLVTNIDHWIAFVLLGLIGANMIRESFGDDDDEIDCSFCPKAMLPLAVATSIDALAIGVTFACLKVEIFSAVSVIGVTTFLFSAIGVKIGNVFGTKFKSKAEFVGGLTLILMGLKILLEHLDVINF